MVTTMRESSAEGRKAAGGGSPVTGSRHPAVAPDSCVAHRAGPRRLTVIHPASSARLNLFAALSQLVRYRDLLYTLSLHRVRVRYKQTLLGISWAILQPLSVMVLFTFIFSVIAKMPSEGAPYAVFSYTALLPWTFFSTALATGSNSLLSNSQLITKVYFPREILPLTYVIAALVDFMIASSVLVGLLLYYKIPLTANAAYGFLIVPILMLFVTAMALFFSATQLRYRDIGIAMPLLLQVWMFATPVIYPLGAVPGRLRPFYSLNPTVSTVENFRRCILYGEAPDFHALAVAALISTALLAGAYLYFKRVEATMADIL
jgi:lipopolysaccharide transport system permease protein